MKVPSSERKCGASQCLCEAITSFFASGSNCCGLTKGPSHSMTREMLMSPTARCFICSSYGKSRSKFLYYKKRLMHHSPYGNNGWRDALDFDWADRDSE